MSKNVPEANGDCDKMKEQNMQKSSLFLLKGRTRLKHILESAEYILTRDDNYINAIDIKSISM